MTSLRSQGTMPSARCVFAWALWIIASASWAQFADAQSDSPATVATPDGEVADESEPGPAPPGPEADEAALVDGDAAASAVEVPEADSAPSWLSGLRSRFHVHGFVSGGAFVSTDNDYIGNSSRGSLKLFDVALNTSVDLTDQLRVGMQLVYRAVGDLSEPVPQLDWGFMDYHWFRWLGFRAGKTKLPLGLYNEVIAIDAARNAILLPSSLYPLRNRDALVGQIGFSAYGNVPLGPVGELDYQTWIGTLQIPRSALELSGASLASTDARYVTGGQVFWQPPVEGLRLGGTYFRASIDFNVNFDASTLEQLVAADLVPADHDGALLVSQDPTSHWVGSIEYIRGDWLLAGEYSRAKTHQKTSLPGVVPATNRHEERFYAMVNYRPRPYLELGTYFSVIHADVDNRKGDGDGFTPRYLAWQRDLAGTLRIDVNEYWLWKVEGHFMDGAADLHSATNPSPERFWGLFLLRTTVTF